MPRTHVYPADEKVFFSFSLDTSLGCMEGTAALLSVELVVMVLCDDTTTVFDTAVDGRVFCTMIGPVVCRIVVVVGPLPPVVLLVALVLTTTVGKD